jgi:hypothetical protein
LWDSLHPSPGFAGYSPDFGGRDFSLHERPLRRGRALQADSGYIPECMVRHATRVRANWRDWPARVVRIAGLKQTRDN